MEHKINKKLEIPKKDAIQTENIKEISALFSQFSKLLNNSNVWKALESKEEVKDWDDSFQTEVISELDITGTWKFLENN